MFGGVGQFAKAIGEFDAARVYFEAFGKARIGRARPGECGFGDRIFRQQRQPAMAELGLDARDDNLAEQIGPAVIGGDSDADSPARGGKAIAITEQRRQGDPGKTIKGFAERQHFGFGTGDAAAPLPAQRVILRRRQRHAAQRHRIVHHLRPVGLGTIPFDHGEFRRVQRPRLAVAPDPGEIDDVRFAGGQQLFRCEFRRGVKVARFRRAALRLPMRGKGMEVRFIAG